MRIIIVCACFLLFIDCTRSKRNNPDNIISEISCNAEKTTENKFISSVNKYKLNGVSLQSDIASYSGSYSILTTKSHPYGFTFEYDNIKPDQYFEISVWCKGKSGKAVIVADGMDKDFYKAAKTLVTTSDGWKNLVLSFYLPLVLNFEKLKIYVWNPEGDSIFFDDFKVIHARSRNYPKYKEPALQIIIDTANLSHLKEIRNRAFQLGYLKTYDDSYVKTVVIYGNDTLKGKIRFKGDFLSHIEGEKWSFRIKLKSKYRWRGMRSFSLHSPKARDFLDEKIVHDFCRANDLLATRYGFVPVLLNGKSLGIYAYEEHFRKELVESLNRREGVIIKPSEDEVWFGNNLVTRGLISSNIPYYEASSIEPFQENKVGRTKILFNQFEIAQNLFFQFRHGLKPVSDIFETDKLSKYMAIVDIMAGYHGIHWHNIRFYYNPVSSKLEPIAFDNYMGGNKIKTIFAGYYFYNSESLYEYSKPILNLFNDQVFIEKYLYYLDHFTAHLEEQIQAIVDETMVYESMIRKEFPNYRFTYFYKSRMDSIKTRLEEYKTYIYSNLYKKEFNYRLVSDNTYEYQEEIPNYLVKVYTLHNQKNGDINLEVVNYFNSALEIVGYEKSGGEIISLDKKITIPARESKEINTHINNSSKIKYLHFNTFNDSIYKHRISVCPWSKPDGEISFQSMNSKSIGYLKQKGLVKGNCITFRKGTNTINKSLHIPGGYKIVFEPGTRVDIINHAAFISNSPVQMKGEQHAPVIIKSSDGTAMGFSVMKTKQSNILENVVFDQLNTLHITGWTLTGAVNFYDSDVEMNNVSFTNNRCEDALNIIHSYFTMNNCMFDNIYADAFDSDFSTGILTNSKFRDINNDAIDFSGSEVKINNCQIFTAGDKGISGGENSTLTVNNISVTDANIGVASKDNSIIQANNVIIDKCNYGLVVFTKKVEYGPASVHINGLKITNTNMPQLIEEKSQAIINNKKITGKSKKVSELFYL